LARLRALAGGDEARLGRLLATAGGDAVRLEALLARVRNDVALYEYLIAALGDGAGVERLLGRIGDDLTLVRRLRAAVGDGAELGRLLRYCGDDAALLDEIIRLAGNNRAGLLEIWFDLAGPGKGPVFVELMQKARASGVDSGAAMEALMNCVNSSNRFDELASLVRRIPHPPAAPPGVPVVPRPRGWNLVADRWRHFLEEHVIEFFNHPNVGPNGKTFWPEGTTPQQVADILQDTIDVLHTPEWQFVRPGPGADPVTVMAREGMQVQIGLRGDGVTIGQFFPSRGSAGCITIETNEANAIRRFFP
jgi:hypothetical protein